MAFLSPTGDETERLAQPSGRRHGRAWALALAIAAAGCALFNTLPEGKPKSGFPHAQHGEDKGLECSNCHRGAEHEDAAGMPLLAVCQLCHQQIDADKPPERRATALFEDGKLRRTPRDYQSSEILFSHQKHAPGTECKACHEGIETDAPQQLMRMNTCVQCHKQKNAANECSTCHRDLRADRAPPNHAFGWQRSHGLVVRAHDTATVNDCTLCHQESGCSKCHREVPPANHDNYFRLRGHGLMARMDRQNCAACHRSDSCDACHKESRPITHVGSFGTPRNNHCISCHLPVTNTECFTCHRSTPSHATATPMPPDHNPAMNCRMCHGRGQPLNHADNGTECTTCHR